jgi:hypothetical protein
VVGWRGTGSQPLSALARCFLRLANLPNFALDRLNRYEANLWRQVAKPFLPLMPSIDVNLRSAKGGCSNRALSRSFDLDRLFVKWYRDLSIDQNAPVVIQQ